jgi:hypothetical protein
VRKIVEVSLNALTKAETYADVHDVIVDVGKSLGFRYFGYQYWPGSEEYGDRNFAGLVQCNYPQAWQARYAEQDFYAVDPIRLFGLDHDSLSEWRLIDITSDAGEQVMREAARHGLENGVIGSFHDSQRGRLQITYADLMHCGEVDGALEVLGVLGPMMTVSLRRAHELESRIRWLTERQRDVFFALRRKRLQRSFENN